MEEKLFIELSIIVISTLVFSGLMRLLKQPVMIGYIIVGILLSPHFLNIVKSTDSISTFSQIGISLLLFMVGLNLNPKNIKETGSVTLFAGLGQVVLTAFIGYFLGRMIGFDHVSSIYIAIGVSFSSTIIIMKLLSDMKDLQALYGRISTGILILQDLLAMLMLMVVSAISKGGDAGTMIFTALGKGVGIILVLYLFSTKILPYITQKAAKSQEILLLFSIGWCMALASVFHFLEFSIETGALLAGITLSMSPYKYEIHAKLKPLRDFFIMLFFVLLGSQMTFNSINEYIVPIIVFSIFVLIIKPLLVMIIMGIMGYTKKNGFKTAISLAQVSEFSLILMALGTKIGHLKPEITSFVTMVALISITGSTYFMMYSEKLFDFFNDYLGIFERRGHKVDQHIKHTGAKHEVIVLGFSKLGSEIVKGLIETKKRFLVVDFDPKNIFNLTRQGIDCRYGDIGNTELFEELNFEKVKMVVSTIKDFDTNSLLINKIRNINKDTIIIVLSHQIDEALALYDEGADYVIMPNYIGGYHTSGLISEYGFDLEKFLQEKTIHVNQLLIRKQINFGKN
jgi:Kef-type K+ transport system membrane component KefB/Trk K+ transport system NAD-binding subunit